MNRQEKRNKISAEYYDNNFCEYDKYYSDEHLHYGFWFNESDTHEDSLLNTVKEVAKLLEINSNDFVLDAGCGTGGACIHIANTYNAVVYGITMSDELISVSKKLLKKCSNSHDVHISKMSYTDMVFKNNMFDEVYAIESVCHAENKIDFIKEISRVIKPKGILVVADYFKIRNELNVEEEKNYYEWLDGWAIPYLATVDEFVDNLKFKEFYDIECFDMTRYIKKSSFLMHEYAEKSLNRLLVSSNVYSFSTTKLKHFIATSRQKYCIDNSIWGYYLIRARK